jgi:hypothetical protein
LFDDVFVGVGLRIIYCVFVNAVNLTGSNTTAQTIFRGEQAVRLSPMATVNSFGKLV